MTDLNLAVRASSVEVSSAGGRPDDAAAAISCRSVVTSCTPVELRWTGPSVDKTYCHAYAYAVQEVQPEFVAAATFAGVTLLGSPVRKIAWTATAVVEQPVQPADVASARFELSAAPPAKGAIWSSERVVV